MRYVWASLIAAAIISLGVFFVRQTHVAFEQKAREAAAASGHSLQQGSDSNLQDVGVEVSSSEMVRIQVADILTDFWYVFVVLVFLTCFGVSAFAGRQQSSSGPTSTRSEH
jgi:hypothetical protein